jgi:hypothetical protein
MLYIIYDSALNGLSGLIALQHLFPQHRSLFKGTKDETLVDVAPYLFTVEEDFSERIQGLDLSLEALLVIETERDIEKLTAHFQRFIYQTVNKREYFFRFWDARVLQKFLPTCEESQLRMIFDGVKSYTCRSEMGLKQFMFTPYGLQTTKVNLGKPGYVLGKAREIEGELVA